MELCWMLPFLAVTPLVREGTQFYAEVRSFFEVCVEFLASHHAYCNDSRLFVYSFYRLLYLAAVDYY
uniref:Secreted protein n=1 Tax=Parascaris equorum TaxID=6256 RepID=A0A914S072_PAREQ